GGGEPGGVGGSVGVVAVGLEEAGVGGVLVREGERGGVGGVDVLLILFVVFVLFVLDSGRFLCIRWSG
ncbi:hypothetical protein AAHH78_42155, partial [Burkholderia pseudomallei]